MFGVYIVLGLLFEVVISYTEVNVVVKPVESELSVGSSVTLTCILEDIGPVQWEYPDETDPAGFLIKERYFTIKSISEKNTGVYRCKYLGFSEGVLKKGEGSSVVRIRAERPGQPQNLQVTSFLGDSVSLKWEAGFYGYADTLYYKLEYMKEDSSWLTWHDDIPHDVLNYTVTQLPLEMSYRFRITQISKGGESNPSDTSSVVFLPKNGAVTVHPTLERIEQYNSTAVRVIWSMPEFSDIVTQWFIECRVLQEDRRAYKSTPVRREDISSQTTISFLAGLEEYKTYQIRMYCRNEYGRGPPSPIKEITTNQAAPSAPPRNVRVEHRSQQLKMTWLAPQQREINGKLVGYQIKIYYVDPAVSNDDTDVTNTTEMDVTGLDTMTTIPMPNTSLPCWVAVAARTEEGLGPFSRFEQVTLPVITESHSVNTNSLNEVIALFKQPWLIAIIGVLLIVLIVMISIIACRQQKIKRRKMEQQQHTPFLKSYHSSVNSSMNGSGQPQYRMSRDDGPQYEKIPDSRNNTPHGSRSFDGRMFDQRSTPESRESSLARGKVPWHPTADSVFIKTPEGIVFHNATDNNSPVLDITNSYIDNRMPPPNYCPSNLSMDSQRYSMSQNSSIDDLASTIPSVTYSLPHNREGYKVVNPTSNERGPQSGPNAQIPPKAKEHDPSLVKPKVYGNITVKEWREQQLRKKTRGDANSDTSLLSSFGRGSTDNVSVSGSESEGSDIEKYLEEDFSPRNSGYIEDDLMDVARMGMSRSPPDNSTFLHPNNMRQQHHPPVSGNTFRGDDATSIESDLYMRCEAAPNSVCPANIYNLNGGVSEIED